MIHLPRNILFYEGNHNVDQAELALVSISIESSLLGYGVKTYERVVTLLNKKYGCDIPDCYTHPEYLNEVFQALSENSRYSLIRSIRKGLEEFSYIDGISKFLDKLDR